jgi:hypothetical protein
MSPLRPASSWVVRVGATLGLAAALAACSSASPSPAVSEFVVAVGQERFALRTSDAETALRALGSLRGENRMFPIGPLHRGDGSFNAPWSWHFDPAETRFTEVAIEVCDGTPSYVEANLADFPTYCPWSARVVGVRPGP